MKVGVINCGSSSIKYEVFDVAECIMISAGLVEKIGSADSRLLQRKRKTDGSFEEHSFTKPLSDHREAFEFIASMDRQERIIEDDSEVFGIGHRVVHGGEVFHEPTLIDDRVIADIRRLSPLAPLHNPSNLLGIEVALVRFPDIPQVAVFDTAFHQTIPPHAYHYALPYELYAEHHVRRYGFHGTSHEYVAKEASRHLGKPLSELSLITLHLGNGASAAAIKEGRSMDTSMGMTPIEGLMMGTRCGDIDPALHFYLIRQTGMSADEIDHVFNSQSGLRGICGVSDMREIQGLSYRGDERAKLALDMFCYRIKKYIGAYCAVLGRLDAIVFTGGIGENASAIRQRACDGLEHLGISVDPGRNNSAKESVSEIHHPDSKVRVLVIKTNEELAIAEQTIRTIRRKQNKQGGRP